ncbi:MAG: hypothetical protein GXO54_07995 [Chloroflexi bacterium]|nr:hypothetical protein [Chloroflexota bacterium]
MPRAKPRLFIIILGFLGLTWVAARTLPPGIDWHETYYPAARAVLAGRSPYEVAGFRIAPWAIVPFLPLGLLPEDWGRAAYFVLSLFAYAWLAWRLGARGWTLALALLAPPVWHGLLNANIDWLPMLGFVLPPRWGLFFLVIKPQVGIGLTLYWFIQAVRQGGWRRVLHDFGPVSLALGLSVLLFGPWPLRFQAPLTFWWNASLWPASLPIGLALLTHSVRTQEPRWAMVAGPFFAPYILFHSWVAAVYPLAPWPAEFTAVVLGLWGMVLWRGLSG